MITHPKDPNQPDIVVREHHPRREPRTGIHVAAGALITLLILGFIWIFNGQSEREELARDTEIVINERTDVLQRDEILDTYTVEVQSLKSEAELLAEGAGTEYLSRINAYQNRVSALESRMAQVPNGTMEPSERTELEAELAAAREEYRALKSELSQTTEELEETTRLAEVNAAQAEASAAEAEMARDEALLTTFLDDANDQVEELREDLQELRAAPNAASFSAEFDALESELETVMAKVADLQASPGGSAPLQQEITSTLLGLEKRIDALDAQTASL